jgi:general secretion pathway protein I
MKSRRGFTLLEVMVATTIMGVAVVTLMAGLSGSMRNASRLTDYDRAALLARARMDTLLADPDLPRNATIEQPIDPAALGGAEGGWRARVTPFDTGPAPAPGKPCLDRIELEVWWKAGDQRRSFTLDGFRRGVIAP